MPEEQIEACNRDIQQRNDHVHTSEYGRRKIEDRTVAVCKLVRIISELAAGNYIGISNVGLERNQWYQC